MACARAWLLSPCRPPARAPWPGPRRQTDYAGGCNGARIRLPPLAGFDVNKGMDQVIALLEPLKAKYGAGEGKSFRHVM